MFTIVSFCRRFRHEKVFGHIPPKECIYLLSNMGNFRELKHSSNLLQMVLDRNAADPYAFDKRSCLHFLEHPYDQRLMQKLQGFVRPYELSTHDAVARSGNIVIEFYELEAATREELAESAEELSAKFYWYNRAIETHQLLASFQNHKNCPNLNHNYKYRRKIKNISEALRQLARKQIKNKYQEVV